MSQQEQRGQGPGGFDPEAEQEVDFSRYARLLAMRWWLLAAGLVAGALIGYAVSLSGTRLFKASATLYVGQPFSAGGGQLQTLQTAPTTISEIVHAEAVLEQIATECKAKPGDFRGRITSAVVESTTAKNAQTPLVRITVQAKRGKAAACAANRLARKVVDKIGVYARQRIDNFRRRIATDTESVTTIKTGLASVQVSTTDKLLFQLQLRNFQEDEIAANQLLLQAEQVEAPSVLTSAAAQRAPPPRSRRNSLVVAALIGLVLGIVAALLWDRVAARLPRPDEE
jgi:capsular polysaccharide biosynthesis protein